MSLSENQNTASRRRKFEENQKWILFLFCACLFSYDSQIPPLDTTKKKFPLYKIEYQKPLNLHRTLVTVSYLLFDVVGTDWGKQIQRTLWGSINGRFFPIVLEGKIGDASSCIILLWMGWIVLCCVMRHKFYWEMVKYRIKEDVSFRLM